MTKHIDPVRGRLRDFVRSPSGLALAVFLAVAGYFLWSEHRAHTIAALPYLLLGGCLVMHFFMHRGHGHGGHGERETSAGMERKDGGQP